MDISREQWDRLYRYCLALAGQPADAEDLLHSTVERYLAVTTEVVQNPLAWMRRVARNLYYDQLRRSQRVPFESLEFPDEFPGTEACLERSLIDERRLQSVWQTFSPGEREVMFLWAAEEMSASEIALQLGQPRGSILSRLHRMRQKVNSLVQPQAGSLGDANEQS
ncbi:RNA polymerase sigma factor [Pseudomonas sp. GD03696]|uniref:RNA polymerase sigma factor n=1 Tax=Pseudomonas sp. GD03696 TaxID=2975368 RepID=UPI00244B3377|nr:RNA polymerase sigma factor [Pseudomonas sp. GD03696]MDH1932830.1 RNA polymerase sigma factor [Pseudomonas sp. GD03696]